MISPILALKYQCKVQIKDIYKFTHANYYAIKNIINFTTSPPIKHFPSS